MSLLQILAVCWIAYGIATFIDVWEDMSPVGFRPKLGDFIILVLFSPIFAIINFLEGDQQ